MPSRFRRTVVDPLKRFIGVRRWTAARARYRALQEKVADRVANRRWRVAAPRLVMMSESSDTPHRGFLEWLGRERPDLRRHVHLDRLPCDLPPDTVLLHAWVRDPVAERAPAIYAQLLRLEAECARLGIVVVHPAAVLSNSKRDVLYERLSQAGVRTPRTAIVDEKFPTHRHGLRLPFVVRRRWGHNRGMKLVDNEAAFDRWWERAAADPASWVAAEYIDVRSRDGLYRKWRYFMAGSQGITRHLIVSRNWEVRPEDRVKTEATREEELAFVGTPCEHHAAFDAARLALEFEIAAFDYSYEPDGKVVVWEVNPYPNISRPAGDVGAYLSSIVDRSYAMLADFYVARAGL